MSSLGVGHKGTTLFKKLLVLLTLIVSLQVSALVENKDGSVLLSAKELSALNSKINSLLQQAYEAGVKDGVEAVKSNPKLCPKDI
jgi:hypothetical protein